MMEYISLVDSIACEIEAGYKYLDDVGPALLPHPFDIWKGNKLIPNIKYFVDNCRNRT